MMRRSTTQRSTRWLLIYRRIYGTHLYNTRHVYNRVVALAVANAAETRAAVARGAVGMMEGVSRTAEVKADAARAAGMGAAMVSCSGARGAERRWAHPRLAPMARLAPIGRSNCPTHVATAPAHKRESNSGCALEVAGGASPRQADGRGRERDGGEHV